MEQVLASQASDQQQFLLLTVLAYAGSSRPHFRLKVVCKKKEGRILGSLRLLATKQTEACRNILGFREQYLGSQSKIKIDGNLACQIFRAQGLTKHIYWI